MGIWKMAVNGERHSLGLVAFVLSGSCILSDLGGAVALAADTAAQTASATNAEEKTWSVSFDTEARLFSWQGTRGYPSTPFTSRGSGSEWYMPLSLSAAGNPSDVLKLEFLLRGGYVGARQSTPGQSGNASTMTDTSFTTTVTYTGWEIAQPFASLAFNLPTGTAALMGQSRFARMDPDLVDIPTFGEGFNVGPTLGANIPLSENLMLTLGAGYTSRGAFNREGPTLPAPQGTQRAKPGDVATASAALGYQDGPWTARLSSSYAIEQTTLLDGVAQYRAGPVFNLSLAAGYSWNDNWSSSANFAYQYGGKNLLPSPITLAAEPFNSNSSVYRATIDTTYKTGAFQIGPTFSWLYRDHNGYDSTNLSFVAAKTKWSAGVVGRYSATDKISITGRVERLWVSEGGSPIKLDPFGFPVLGTLTPQVVSNAWIVSLGASIQY